MEHNGKWQYFFFASVISTLASYPQKHVKKYLKIRKLQSSYLAAICARDRYDWYESACGWLCGKSNPGNLDLPIISNHLCMPGNTLLTLTTVMIGRLSRHVGLKHYVHGCIITTGNQTGSMAMHHFFLRYFSQKPHMAIFSPQPSIQKEMTATWFIENH